MWSRFSTKAFVIGAAVGLSYAEAEARNKRMSVKSGKPLKIVIFGPPGSGKGTQCDLIAEEFGVVHISTGDMFRSEVKRGTPFGKLAKSYMDKGALVPSSVCHDMVKSRLYQPDCTTNGFILDGFPREEENTTFLVDNGFLPDIFLILDVPDDELVARLTGRRRDPVTNKVYHLKYAPPETPEIAARLVQRPDDEETVVKARIQKYKDNLEASLAPLPAGTTMVYVNGNRKKDKVFLAIKTMIENHSSTWG